jgi:hypothetical protein
MRSFSEIAADAQPGSAFSNNSQFEYWAGGPRGCYSCRNDSMDRPGPEKFCPILSVAVTGGGIPQEWTTGTDEDHIHGNYTCTEYDRRPDGGGDGDDEPEPDPGPPPVMEGQIDLFEVFADRIADEASAMQVEAVAR